MADPSSANPNIALIALGVAILGLLQTWAIELWRKYGAFGSVQTYPAASLSLWYNGLGPAVMCRLTLRAQNKDYFVVGITATVTRLADGAKHDLAWRHSLSPDPSGQAEPQLSFSLRQSADHQLCAVFVDEQTRVAMGEHLSAIRNALNTFLRERLGDRENTGVPTDELEALYTEFRSSPVYLDAYSRLERLCYWDAGDYSIAFAVRTSRPDKQFTTYRKFAVVDATAQALMHNAVGLTRFAEGEENPFFSSFDVELAE